MRQRINLTINEFTIERSKLFAKKNGKSLSRLIEETLEDLME